MLLVLVILYLLPGYLNANAPSGSDTSIVSRRTSLLAPSFPHACVCLDAQNRSRWDIFIAQCIARKLQGLVITELELSTLAIAALNVVMYIFWRNKPLDVATTVPVRLLQPSGPVPPTSVEPLGREAIANEVSNAQDIPKTEENEQKNWQGIIDIESLSPSAEIRKLHNFNFVDLARQVWWLISGILYRWIASGGIAVVARMGEIRFTDTISEGEENSKTFYAYNPTPHKVNVGKDIVLLFVGMLLGAIHCVGWNFFFPSLIEANVWRISSAVITGIPAVGLVSILFLGLDEDSMTILDQTSFVT
ncbi:hypothetical protein GALMADRAFT_145489 [Galerina marginata CBS 339.88]|uniref:Uncharacterized protein n=1 Tax=Galerina marginata (strain CBS 339.88) TaxID=685588 RepID=A0A067SP62_GALM3|nr:hypothetical protein GALMADRAFT_145489 [Galerina marginata CBS 339.88]